MCNACIIENVRQSVMSRRSLFAKSAAAGAAAIAASMVSAKVSLAQSSGKVVDLTHTYDDKFPTFDGKPSHGISELCPRRRYPHWMLMIVDIGCKSEFRRHLRWKFPLGRRFQPHSIMTVHSPLYAGSDP